MVVYGDRQSEAMCYEASCISSMVSVGCSTQQSQYFLWMILGILGMILYHSSLSSSSLLMILGMIVIRSSPNRAMTEAGAGL